MPEPTCRFPQIHLYRGFLKNKTNDLELVRTPLSSIIFCQNFLFVIGHKLDGFNYQTLFTSLKLC